VSQARFARGAEPQRHVLSRRCAAVDRLPTAIKVATPLAARGGAPPLHTKCRFTAHTRAAGNSKREPMEANMYEDALKAIEGMTKIFFHSKDEFIEWLAARNPKWVQFADRMWTELLVRCETAIAAIGEIRDGLLIDGVWVGEIGGVVKVYFALMDDGTEEIEDFAEHLVKVLTYLLPLRLSFWLASGSTIGIMPPSV
jgi:hypothetical protein